jgi:hypothetical protein
MAPVLDATLGGPTSNSYVELATAVVIANNLPGGGTWIAATDDEKNLSLITATRWLETLNYVGDRCAPTQRLKWPRSGAKAVCDGVQADCTFIPPVIQEAEVALAIKYVENPGAFPGSDAGSSAPSGTFTKRQKLGDLEIEYAQFNSNVGSSCDDCDNPQIIQSFPWIDDALGCWLNMGPSSGAGFVLTRECCPQTPLSKAGPAYSNLMPAPPYNTM